MRYAKIRKMDISNGEGIRTSIFVQGCGFRCRGCFNQETHDFNGGMEYTEDVQNALFEASKPFYIVGLSILGGEPLHPSNVDSVALLIHDFKSMFPNKNVWVWTGYTYEYILEHYYHALINMDVLIDGKFELDKRDIKLKFRGSSNQRLIDVQESLKQNKVILYN